jgi:hypothetical protein
MRQRGNVANAEAPARRFRFTSAAASRRQRDDAEGQRDNFEASALRWRGAIVAPSALRHVVGTSSRRRRLLVPDSAVFCACK